MPRWTEDLTHNLLALAWPRSTSHFLTWVVRLVLLLILILLIREYGFTEPERPHIFFIGPNLEKVVY